MAVRPAATAALVLLASACGSKPPAEAAAPDVAALLAAVQAGDAKAFEARLDRPAIRADLRRQLMGAARENGVEVDGGPSDLALDRRIVPDTLKLVDTRTGGPLPAAPSHGQAQALLKPVDKDHVCIREVAPPQPCMLTFAREAAGWRLTGMPAQPGAVVAVGPEAGK